MAKKAPNALKWLKWHFLPHNIWSIHCWSPDFSQNWDLRNDPRACVRPCVPPENFQWLSIVFFWNFAWSYNFIWGKYNILGFLKIILIASPGALLCLKKPPKCPKVAKNDTFCLITFDPSIVFSETRPKCGGNCTKYKTTVTELAKFWFASSGSFRAKIHCIFSESLHGVTTLYGEMLHSRIFENSSRCVPRGSFMAKSPKMP